MNEKLAKMALEYEELMKKMSDPMIISNQNEYKQCGKRASQIETTVKLYHELVAAEKQIAEAKELLKSDDAEMRALAQEELDIGVASKESIEENIKIELLPKDEDDVKNCIVEIRAAAGGDEAALFANELSRMYMRLAEEHRWKTELISQSELDVGGIKEIIFSVKGKGVYGNLKFESGVHRVQRIPVTESKGRVHTSTVTVAVLPEVEDVDVEIRDEDIRVDTYRAGGAGGQHVNKTDSAIRLTHEPSGIVVACQDERSQLKNKVKAMNLLRSKLYTFQKEQQMKARGDDRRAQIGTGDRSEKIRTYNFPQDRVTDHRIKQSFSNIPGILDGNIDHMIEQLKLAAQAEALASSG